MEQVLIEWLKTYGYPVLFVWSIAEGELGLIMAGLLCHTGDMNIALAITVASLGGFAGDQLYFWFGRYNKKYLHEYLVEHRRKFALAHLLLKKYGWPVIFIQRYMYGMRTIIPMAIGATRYSSRSFMIINFLSAIVWASLTIVITFIFGDVLIGLLKTMKEHWYLAIPFALSIFLTLRWYFNKFTKKVYKK